jgi:hypothetical protein
MDTAKSPASLAELRLLASWRDYAFVLLTFLLVSYFFFNVFSVIRVPNWDFDYMFIFGAGGFIWSAWRMDRIGERLPRVLQMLDKAGSIIITQADRERIEREIADRGHRYGLVGMVLIVLLLEVGAYLQYLQTDDLGMVIALALSVAVSGAYAGYRFGQLFANGQLLGVLSKAGYDIKAGGNLGSEALVPLRDLYGIAIVTGMCFCAFFNIWWLGWAIDIPIASNFKEWRWRFLILWVVCMIILFFGGLVPVRRFNRRLDAIYGGAEARQVAARQRDLAQSDLQRLDERIGTLRVELDTDNTGSNRRKLSDLNHRRDELAAYAQGLVDQTYADGLMRLSTLVWFAITSAGLMAVSVLAAGFND